ncbi:MAG TPA: hypothetical protein VLC10_00725 [Patescibacteria group bacterium]|nr:hypothetical protein [Patescibacteria group bacterium]
MKKAARVLATVPAVILLIAAVPLTYCGLGLFLSERLLTNSDSGWPLLMIFGGPVALFAAMLIFYRLYPAQFR